jgi:hypothetical protein
MPYKSTSELGKGKEGLPAGAKKIFMGAFNAAVKKYGEGRASAIAWAAVKLKYKKNKEGEWVAKTGDEAPIELVDHVETMTLDLNDATNVQITKEGFMVAVPRIARTGIQLYKGAEMGIDDDDAIIHVYRPEGEVFDWEAIRSLAFRPVTFDHPPEMVVAANWRKYAVGTLGGDFARDGQFIRFPMTIMDGEAVKAIKAGQAQLSVGYTSNIKWEDGTSPEGEPYDAIQTSIRANHVAVVGMARGGDKLKIGDMALPEAVKKMSPQQQAAYKEAYAAHQKENPDATEEECMRAAMRGLRKPSGGDVSFHRRDQERSKPMTDLIMRPVVIDGVSVELPEISAQVVTRALADRDDENKALRTQVDQREAAASQTLADQRKVIDEKDGQIMVLKRQLADNELTPARIDKAVRERLEIFEKARAIMGDTYVCDGRTDIEIKRAVVSARYGEQFVKALSDEALGGAFMGLTIERGSNATLARSLGDVTTRGGGIHSSADAAQIAYDERSKRMANAWRQRGEKTS